MTDLRAPLEKPQDDFTTDAIAGTRHHENSISELHEVIPPAGSPRRQQACSSARHG